MDRSSVSRGWLIFSLIAPIYMLSIFQRMAPSILAPDLALSFSVRISELTIISSATFIIYGLMQLPAGLLTDAIGGRKTIFILTIAAGVGSTFFGFATNLQSAALSRFILGIGCAVTVPAMSMLAENFSEQKFARVNGLFLTCGHLGTVLAGAPLALMLALCGWRPIMIFLGVLFFMLGLTLFMLVKKTVIKRDELSFKHLLHDLWKGLKIALTTYSFWPVCLWFCFSSGLMFAFTGLWQAPYLINGCGLTKTQAGLIISTAFLVNLAGLPLMAILSDKLRSRKIVIIGCSFMAFFAMIVLPFFGSQMPFYLLMLDMVLFSVGFVSGGSVAFASAKESFPLNMVGTALGIFQTLPYLLMTPLLQKLFAIVVEYRLEQTGQNNILAYGDAIWVNVGCCLVTCLFSLFVKETYK